MKNSFMKFIIALLFIAFGFQASAQAVMTTVKFNKADRPALMLYLPYNKEVAEGTILTKLKEIGFEPETKNNLFWKQNKVDGFYAFKGVVLKGEKTELVDFYFKVDRRGNKIDSQSVVYMITSNGGENFVAHQSEPNTHAEAQKFLNGFVLQTASYKLLLDVKTQEGVVRKGENKLAELVEEEKLLTDKITRLQEEIKKNQDNQANQKALIESEKKKLSGMKVVKQ